MPLKVLINVMILGRHCEFTRSHVDRSIKHSSPSCHGVPQIVNYDWIMVRIEMENGEHSGALAQINFREGCSKNFRDCDRDVVNNTSRVIFWEMSPFESYKKLAWGLRRTFSTIINSPRIEMIVKTLFLITFATRLYSKFQHWMTTNKRLSRTRRRIEDFRDKQYSLNQIRLWHEVNSMPVELWHGYSRI